MVSSAHTTLSTLSLRPSGRAGYREALVAIAGCALVLLAIWRLVPHYGLGVAALLTIPLAVTAWSFGLRGALIGSALALPTGMFVCLRATDEPLLFSVVSAHIGVLFIACVTGRLRDLTLRVGRELEEHARAVRLLRRGEARNQALLGALPDLIFRLSVNGQVSGASGARGRASSLRSTTYLDQLISAEAAQLMQERAREVLRSGLPSELEYQGDEQAEMRDYEARLVKCASDRVLVIVRNVTREKRLQRELITAKEAALEAARSKTKFLANMSHEIRTPMNGVIGMTHLLLETQLGQEQREYAQIIQKSGQSLLTIIDDILDFAKIEAGRLELDCIDFDLHMSVEEALEGVASQAQAKGLDLGCVIDRSVPRRVHADPTRLRQVLANLLSNAVKFTEQGAVLLELSVTAGDGTVPSDPKHASLLFRVRDTGPGVPSELVPRLFRPLLLGENAAGGSREGTGLGLAIAHELVQLMGGEIRYEPAPGAGAVFAFEVQLRLREAAEAEPVPDFSGKRVLIVRSPDAARRVLDKQLQSLSLELDYAPEGESRLALAQARREGRPYLAVLLEGGRDLATDERAIAAVRGNEALDPVPVVLILAGEIRSGLHEEVRQSATRVLHWPVRRGELVGCLSALTGRTDAVATQPRESVARLSAHVLVAEDNPINQRVAQRSLQILGCTSELVDDGKQALQAVLEGHYDVVLMDCQMPVMDGFEAARQIRALEQGRRTPIIAMTAGSADSDRERCREAQMDDYVTKPVALEQLRDVITKQLTPRPVEPSASAAGALRTDDVLDMRAIDELRQLGGDDPGFLRELVDLFLEQAPRHLEVARVALDVGDLEAAGKAAHTLKSSSAYLGAMRLSRLCQELEGHARAGAHAPVSSAIEAMRAELFVVRHALTALIA